MRRFFDTKLIDHFDWALFSCVAAILFLSLLNLYSATFDLPAARFFRSQLVWISIGTAVATFVLFFDYRLLERLSLPIYCLSVLLVALVLFTGRSVLGAQRWLQIGPLSLQPSELAKIGIVIGLARYFHTWRGSRALSLAGLFWPGLMTAVPVLLILKQPDLGTAIIVFSISAAMILFVGVRNRVLALAVVAALIAIPFAWRYALRPYQKSRVQMFLNPERDALGQGYQIIQSKIAIGAGEFSGKGYLKGTQSKLQFLPKQYTDFVFSNFAEEFGFLGSILLLGLYASVSLLGLNVAFMAKERFGMMLGVGLTALVTSQAVINLGMEMGLLPVVGVTLPLFSYGGTSLITTLFAVGLLLNISMRRYMF